MLKSFEQNKIFTDAAAAITSVHGKTYTGGAGYEAMCKLVK